MKSSFLTFGGRILLLLVLVAVSLLPGIQFSRPQVAEAAAIGLSNGTPAHSQNFDSLPAATGTWTDDSTLSGWYSTRTAITANHGSFNTGNLYSFGSLGTTERALGSIGSDATGTIFWGVRFVNNGSTTISSLQVNYTGEQWRYSGTAAAQTVDFGYQVGATALTTGTWTDFNALDFTSPITGGTTGALDGNLTANRTIINSTITSLTISPGQEIWLRWSDINHGGSDHGLAIDDLTITATFAIPDTTPPNVNSVTPAHTASNIPVTDNVVLTFDEAVNVAGNWFSLVCGATTIDTSNAAVTGNGTTTLTINPPTPPDLPYGTTCNLTVTNTAVADLAGNTLDGNFTSSFTTVSADTISPTVNVSPVTGTGNVAITENVVLTFSEVVNVAGSWFTLVCGATTIDITNAGVTGSGTTTITINPNADLAYSTTCNLTVIGTQVTDTAGNQLNGSGTAGSNFTSNFTTAAPPDTTPPTVVSNPANGATDVTANTNVVLTFSEVVNVTGSWFSLVCGGTTINTSNAVVTGSGTTTVTIDPTPSLPYSTTCDLTLTAANVTDLAGNQLMGGTNFTASFTTGAIPITRIHTIQGSGTTSPLSGQTHTIQGVVVADFQLTSQLRGFFIQEETSDEDGNPATSEGIFIFTGNTPPLDVAEGQVVRVTGNVSEFNTVTQITATAGGSITSITPGNNLNLVTPASVDLPIVGDIETYYEARESMLVSFVDTLTVSEYFELPRFGQVVLFEGGRPTQYTQEDSTITAAEYTAYLDELNRRRVIMDDDDDTQNSTPMAGGRFYYPQPNGFGTGTQGTNFFRGGDTVSNLTGVLQRAFGAWRIRPVANRPASFTVQNPRPGASPVVTGDIRVSGYNILNYFLTLDTTSSDDSGPCGPSTTLDCRGADSNAEFTRQQEKLRVALLGLNADVFGLVELENRIDTEESVALLLGPEYTYVDTGFIGTDAIKVGIVYKPAVVEPVGSYAILQDAAFINPNGYVIPKSRPALAQTFRVIDPSNPSYGAVFTVVVVHLKSKGASDCTLLDCDQNDGQGAYNDTRTKGAQALIDWLATDPTGMTASLGAIDTDYMIMGDFNAYYYEDPMRVLYNAGYSSVLPDSAYSYVFSGQIGALDHILVSSSLQVQVADAEHWHINADEVPVFDYNDDVRDTGEASFEEEPDGNPLYEPNQFRTSDHDPVLVGLRLTALAPVVTLTTPTPTATNVSVDTNLVLTFNEAVNVTGNWFSLDCAGTIITPVSATVTTTDNITYTLDPTAALPQGTLCSLVVDATLVTNLNGINLDGDNDGTAGGNYTASFSTALGNTGGNPPTNPPGNSGNTPANEVAQGRPFRDTDFIIKSVDKSLAQIGDTLTYTIVFSNPKGSVLRQVVIADPLDSRLDNVRVVSSSLGTATINGNTITVQGFELLPGQRVTLVISATISNRVRSGDKIINIATLESPDASIHVSNAAETIILPGALPATGETHRLMQWLPWLILIAGILILIGVLRRQLIT